MKRIFMQTLCGSGTRLDLQAAIEAAAQLQPLSVDAKCSSDILDFVKRRLEQFLVDGGLTVEVAKAVLNERACDPVLVQQSARDLQVCPCDPWLDYQLAKATPQAKQDRHRMSQLPRPRLCMPYKFDSRLYVPNAIWEV